MTKSVFIPLLAVLALASCQSRADRDEPRLTQTEEPREALSEELMIALSQAKNYHGKADVYAKSGDVKRAIAEVEHVLSIPFPRDAPEGEDVLADAHARLAKLLLGSGELDRALRVANEGIAQAGRDSFFVANLHTVRAEVLEAQAARIEDSQPDQARRLRREAISAFDRSIGINNDLQRKLATEISE